jgi:hypothetical protein
MTEFVEENVREFEFNLEQIPESLTYKLIEADFTFGPERFGVNEWKHIEYYEAWFEKAYPGLLRQFPCLYYMVEEWHQAALQSSPLDEILAKQGVKDPLEPPI